ncbi:MAG TPA: hypothetical protein VLG69_03155 [Candidatus Andersenbacteria bacterium]|nr:hypothetical protein [Candidatus Andersenbacteria bacterium]
MKYKLLAAINLVVSLIGVVFYLKYPGENSFSSVLHASVASASIMPLLQQAPVVTLLIVTIVIYFIVLFKKNTNSLAEKGVFLGIGATLMYAATLLFGFLFSLVNDLPEAGIFLLVPALLSILLLIISNLVLIMGLSKSLKRGIVYAISLIVLLLLVYLFTQMRLNANPCARTFSINKQSNELIMHACNNDPLVKEQAKELAACTEDGVQEKIGSCITGIVNITYNPELCDAIPLSEGNSYSGTQRNWCYKNAAGGLRNTTICEKITSEKFKTECFINIEELLKEDKASAKQ